MKLGFPALALGLIGSLLIGSIALARTPDPERFPSLDALEKDARARKTAEERAAAEAARDPIQEAIDAYRDKLVPVTDYARVVQILRASEGDEASYRQRAKDALVARFEAENKADVKVLKAKKEISLEIVDLMRLSKDDDGRALVYEIFGVWHGRALRQSGFKPGDSARKRTRAYKKMKEHLER